MSFINDYIDLAVFDIRKFNLLASGTGSGKTYFIAKEFRNYFPHIKPHEILFIESRSITVDQQAKERGITKYNNENKVYYIKHWNGEEDSTKILEKYGIPIMTYDKIIDILINKNVEGLETLDKVKVIVFDECHTLFSDLFIKNIEMLKVWIRDILYTGKKLIIGLTATPSILEYHQRIWGVTINKLNEEILIKYKVKQLHCTNFDSIPYIVTTQLEGKTLIMCYSYKQCLKLKKEIPNSFILVSKNSKYFTKEMNRVREYIVNNQSIPETFIDGDKEKELNVLIATSTLREGVNLREYSGVKNIVCCFSDELHITQFVGRARYNIDNLVVADTYINADNYNSSPYLKKCRQEFREYMKDKNNTSWFDSISHLVEHDIYKIRKFTLAPETKRFISYINSKWLVPKGITDDKELDKYKIYKNEHKQEIINKVIKCRLLKLYPYQITFIKVINMLEKDLGYTIETKRGTINKVRHTYKLIIDFDEEKINKGVKNNGSSL